MSDNEPIFTSSETLRVLREQRYNPLRNLTPSSLIRTLEAFDIGNLREAAMLFESIADRDDTLKSVKPKREKEVSQLARQVLAKPGSGAAGEKHREVLEDFWGGVRAVNAYDRNERGGFRRLVKQMMTAVSYRHAVHHIVWEPTANGLRATFEFVPLWLFENRTGSLRFLKNPWDLNGQILADREWMVTHGDGLMISCAIGYLAKRGAFNDWLIFSEKFSVPGVLGRTTAKKGSEEGLAMRSAVESFGHDWTGVIYGDDGTHEKPIEIIQAAGNPSGMPMPAVVERVDRKMIEMYRGGDLGTMSSKDGQGTGASLQGAEGAILLADDAETINETLAEISKIVIEWYFGRGVEPLAEVLLVVPQDQDDKLYMDSVTALAGMGVRISKEAVLKRLGIQEADEGEAALGEESQENLNRQEAKDAKEDLANAMDNEALSEWLFDLRSALSKDLQPLGKALAGAMEAGDEAAMQSALRKISEGMPELAGDAAAMSEVLSWHFAEALVGEDEEMANAGNSPGAEKGWETRRANGWMPAPKLITPAEADAELEKGFFVANKDGERIRFGAELKRKLDDKVLNSADRNARKQRLRWATLAVSDGVAESSRNHGNTRKIYAKTFRKGPKHQDVEVIVDTINGYAWNIMVKGGSSHAIR